MTYYILILNELPYNIILSDLPYNNFNLSVYINRLIK